MLYAHTYIFRIKRPPGSDDEKRKNAMGDT